MKRFFSYALHFAMAIAMISGFSACSEEEATPETMSKEETLEALTNTYVKDVVSKTYTNLANETEVLFNKIAALKKKSIAGDEIKQEEVDAVCDSYKRARAYWEESEAWLYGAASDFEIDPSIDTWPLELSVLAEDLNDADKLSALSNVDGTAFIDAVGKLGDANKGFHGIEFVFFRDGQPRKAANLKKDAVETAEEFKANPVTGDKELIFATAAAAYLRDRCIQLEVSWLGDKASAAHKARINECKKAYPDLFKTTVAATGTSFGENMLSAGKGEAKSTYATWRKVVEDILVSGCSGICAEVSKQKLGQAYRASVSKGTSTHKDEDGNEVADDPNYIESPYSYNSFTDFYGNIMSIQNALYGNINQPNYTEASIMAYLAKYNPEMANSLQAKLKAALDQLKKCQDSGIPFVKNPGHKQVKDAMDRVSELDDAINEASTWILKN